MSSIALFKPDDQQNNKKKKTEVKKVEKPKVNNLKGEKNYY